MKRKVWVDTEDAQLCLGLAYVKGEVNEPLRVTTTPPPHQKGMIMSNIYDDYSRPAPVEEYQEGETVHIAIHFAKVAFQEGDNLTVDLRPLETDTLLRRTSIKLGMDTVEVTRVLPAAGRPKPGEVWANAKGDEWWVTARGELIDQSGGFWTTVDEVQRMHGPIFPIWQREDAPKSR